MDKVVKQRINRALTMLKLTLVSNGCGLATDHEGHLFIFEDAELKKNGIDATVDSRSEKIGYKIREARLEKIPYMLVVGANEEAEGTVSVRRRGEDGDLG